ncbi:MAG TPA: hypothetical protein VEL31_13175 [Ktedonobacteraceae bacterium]|nr:hypothetical protein [Ktedonobacteraceae bacterium]
MMSTDLQQRLDYLVERLRSTYDGIGHSSGRPYVYFVYHPSLESQTCRLVEDQLRTDAHLTFHHIDVLHLTIESLAGQEEQREALLNDPKKTNSATGIVRLWARRTTTAIHTCLENTKEHERPVVVLRGLAALHPLSNPTTFMEFIAEKEPRNPGTGSIVPIVLLIPGTRLPQTSHVYLFLDQPRFRLNFYRGEEL